jgi:hypothetical protein
MILLLIIMIFTTNWVKYDNNFSCVRVQEAYIPDLQVSDRVKLT